jgi:hypothetical protein
MASLTITVPDALVQRIRAAFGHNDLQGNRVPATPEEILMVLKSFVKGRVVEYETSLESEVIRNTKSREDWNG